MLRHFFCAFLLLLFLAISAFAQQNLTDLNARKWADSVLNTLNLEEKIGQLFMVAAYSSGNEQHHNALERLIENYTIGGLIFMQGGPVRQAHLTNRFQSQSKIPLLIGMDTEWGLGMRLDSAISFPKPMTLGAIQNTHLIYDMGFEIGTQMKRLGVDVAFAPVVDLNNDPKNSVIDLRSFGENEYQVSRKAKAFMNGIKSAGVIAVAKHFPGRTGTQTDSHDTLPTISVTKGVLYKRELEPYRSLIEGGLDGVMIGHSYVPAFEEIEGLPASLSKKIVTELLVKEMNFQGLIFTDALNMKAISRAFQNGNAELEAFKAGNDLVLFSTQVPATIKKIKKTVRRNAQLRGQLNNSVLKILTYKFKVGQNRAKTINSDNLIANINNNSAQALQYKLYRNAVTTVKNESSLIPIHDVSSKFYASLSIGESDT
ncbi:MAG: glycoside hydrolase family 3 N-terminal domain-containing protein, partial [Bacteroidota bacterium]